MKILLIEPPFYLFQNIKPGRASLGLAMLAAMANKYNHEVKIFSPDLELLVKREIETVITVFKDKEKKMAIVKRRLNEIINSFQPKVVAISFWTARAEAGFEMANHIRKVKPNITIIGGGIHATILPEELLRNGVVDYVIRGEGEFAFVSLLEKIERGENPRNEKIACLSFYDDNKKLVNQPIAYCDNLDDLPYPAYEHFINYDTFNKNAFGSIMFSRGCPFECNYCASYMLWTRKTRFHTPAYIVGMLKHIHKKFGTDYFQFDDDTFTLRKKSVFEICRLLKQEQLPITWHCDTRVECVSEDLLKEMKDVGLTTVAMGIESGDTEIRKTIKKTSSLEITKNAFKIASALQINTIGYFMIGFPGETYTQASRTLDFIEELNPTIPCISICIPYPGTESYNIAVEMGIMGDLASQDWSAYYHHSNINFSGQTTSKEWHKLLIRCDEIEKKFIQLREEKVTKLAIKNMVKKINLKELTLRYRQPSNSIFRDFLNFFSLLVTLIYKKSKKL